MHPYPRLDPLGDGKSLALIEPGVRISKNSVGEPSIVGRLKSPEHPSGTRQGVMLDHLHPFALKRRDRVVTALGMDDDGPPRVEMLGEPSVLQHPPRILRAVAVE
jgi:hypothetical protein